MEKVIFTMNSNKSRKVIELLEGKNIPFKIDFINTSDGIYESKINKKKYKRRVKSTESEYTRKFNFALKIGYTSVASAISDLGKNEFNIKYNNNERRPIKTN